MEKIGYIISSYFGKRATCHPNYINDKIFYIKTQLAQISKLNIKLERIYIICTFDDSVNKPKLLSELYQLKQDRNDIILITRENLGGSYCSWDTALNLDMGFCDYIVLVEDDYTISDKTSITDMLEYFNKDSELFYLCQLWVNTPHQTKSGITVPNHAGISNGMINNKLYHELKNNGLKFQVKYEPATYNVMWENQALFLEPYRKNGNLIKDYTDKYKSTFCIAQDTETVQGNLNGTEIFIPIVKNKF